MSRRTTEQVLGSLVTELQPVARLPTPDLRAAQWSGAVLLLLAAAVWQFADHGLVARRLHDAAFLADSGLALAVALLSTLAAFRLGVPGESPRWRLLPPACSAAWLLLSLALGWSRPHAPPTADAAWGSLGCFGFVVALSLPLTGLLLLMLRRSFPLLPLDAGAAAGLGIGATATLALQFFHAELSGPIDVAAHVAAVAAVATGAAALARRVLAR